MDFPEKPSVEDLLLTVTEAHEALLEQEKTTAQARYHLSKQYEQLIRLLSSGSRIPPLRSPKSGSQNASDYNHILEYLHDHKILDILLEEPKILKRLDFARTPGCWIWTGQMVQGQACGYVQATGSKRRVLRRYFFERFFGEELLQGQNLDSTPVCNNAFCVNPFHAMSIAKFDKLVESRHLEHSLDWEIDRWSAPEKEADQYRTLRPVEVKVEAPSSPQRSLADIINGMDTIPTLPTEE